MRDWFDGVVTTAGSYWHIARLVPSAGRPPVVALLALNVVLGLLPIAFVIATSVMIGRVPAAVGSGVGSAAWLSLVVAFGAAAAAFVGQQILAPLQTALGELVARRVDGVVAGRLIAASLRTAGIGPLEDQNLLNDLSDAAQAIQSRFQTAGQACAGLLNLVARYIQLLGYAAVVAAVFSPVAAVAVLAATMVFRKGQRGGLRAYSYIWSQNIALRRESEYLRNTAMQAPAAKEIRVFGLSRWLTERYRRSVLRWMMPVWAERRRIYFKPYLAYTAFGLAVAAVTLAAIGQAAAAGTISLTALALALQASLAALRLGDFFPEADVQTQYGMFSYDGVARFERGVDAFGERLPAPDPNLNPAGMPRQGIRFDRVSFSYPGSSRLVLDGLDLDIPAGRCTAIVGLNGAGKTTLVKLLARLYEPTSGALLVDGTDVRGFEVGAWRRQIGVIFQDFNRYELPAAENIGVGSVERLGDRSRIREAARKAGIAGALDRLPHGLDTPLSRQYADGADLSGGQWQRVAIARALYALDGGASILVLDEPTAALDVRAEAAFFDRFVDLTRGVTSILISHRFSSVRHADRIVVVEGGRVVEEGSHDGLLERGGRYAELFRLQAQRFTDEDEEPGEPDDTVDEVEDGSDSGPDAAAPVGGGVAGAAEAPAGTAPGGSGPAAAKAHRDEVEAAR